LEYLNYYLYTISILDCQSIKYRTKLSQSGYFSSTEGYLSLGSSALDILISRCGTQVKWQRSPIVSSVEVPFFDYFLKRGYLANRSRRAGQPAQMKILQRLDLQRSYCTSKLLNISSTMLDWVHTDNCGQQAATWSKWESPPAASSAKA
jgi:hypothetical protein